MLVCDSVKSVKKWTQNMWRYIEYRDIIIIIIIFVFKVQYPNEFSGLSHVRDMEGRHVNSILTPLKSLKKNTKIKPYGLVSDNKTNMLPASTDSCFNTLEATNSPHNQTICYISVPSFPSPSPNPTVSFTTYVHDNIRVTWRIIKI